MFSFQLFNKVLKKNNFCDAFKSSKVHDEPLPEERDAHFNLPYWHGYLPNEDTSSILKNNGDFLVRIIAEEDKKMCISIRKDKRVYNAIIDEHEDTYTLHGTNLSFASVRQLVDQYQVRKSPIAVTGHHLVLGVAVRRKRWELRRHMIKLEKKLGAGSYGVVYKATLTLENEKPITVAVKVLTEMGLKASAELWKEARIMQSYDHPHVVKMYGMINDSEPFHLVIEFVNGGSVEDLLKKEDTELSIRRRLRIVHEAALGIDYLHMKGCIHRDIATRNLLVGTVVKVADFGLTRKAKKYKIDTDKPMNLRWLAPDVYESSTVDRTTDVYAFGITIWEIYQIPYEMPYVNWDANAVYKRVIVGGYRLQPTKHMPSELGQLMNECLGDSAKRPSMKMILARVESCMKQLNEMKRKEEEDGQQQQQQKREASNYIAPKNTSKIKRRSTESKETSNDSTDATAAKTRTSTTPSSNGVTNTSEDSDDRPPPPPPPSQNKPRGSTIKKRNNSHESKR